MADLFSVTAPLAIRFASGSRQIMIERIPYRDGLLFLPPFWTRLPIEQALHFVAGPIKGEGPWKAAEAVITVLGCHGSDPELTHEFSRWQQELECLDGYPGGEEIRQLMETHASQAVPGR